MWLVRRALPPTLDAQGRVAALPRANTQRSEAVCDIEAGAALRTAPAYVSDPRGLLWVDSGLGCAPVRCPPLPYKRTSLISSSVLASDQTSALKPDRVQL